MLRIYIRKHAPACIKGDSCKCGWWISGVNDYGVHLKQQALKVYSKAAAEAKRREFNQQGSPASLAALQIRPVPLSEIVEPFLAEHTAIGNRSVYVERNRMIGDMLMAFLQKEGVTDARNVPTASLLKLRQGWMTRSVKPLRPSTANLYMGQIGSMFRFAVRTGKIDKDPTVPIQAIRARKRNPESDLEDMSETRTLPLDEDGDQNYRKIMDSVIPWMKGELAQKGRGYTRLVRSSPSLLMDDPERFRLLLEFMYETGLRISDALHLRPERIVIDSCVASYSTVQIKTGDPVTVFFPVSLAQRLRALSRSSKGYPFYDGLVPWRQFISNHIYKALRNLGRTIGVEGLRPHRFRDSFAVNRLNENMPIDKVSILLGHRNIRTTILHYNPWVKSRHENLRANYLAARSTGEFARPAEVIPFPSGRKPA